MKLLLTSDGFKNKSIIKALQDLVDRPFSELSLVFIPTAANIVDESKDWLINDLYRAKSLGFKFIDIVDIAALPKNIWEKRLEKADILMFGGGDVYYLLKCINDSGLGKMLHKFLKTKVYVGISAGSMVTAKETSLSIANVLYYEKYGTLKSVEGLGLVDFEIRPHLNSKWFPKVRIPYLKKLAKGIKKSFYAIDDETAIKVVDGKVTVISEGKWEKINV